MAETRFMHITAEGKLQPKSDLESALASLESGGYIWLDYTNPERKDLESLIAPLGIHALWVEDCLDEAQVPKIDIFPSGTFLLFNTYIYSDGKLSVGEVNLIIGKNFLVTVSGHTGEAQRFFERLDAGIHLESANLIQGPDFLLHLLLDDIVDGKHKAIETLQGELDSAEEGILKNLSAFKLNRLVSIRRHFLNLRRSLFHEREILTKICRRDSPFIGEKAVYHFRDIYDHLTKYFEEIEISREMLLGLMEMYLSMVNNRISLTANRTNNTMRRLTFIMTIFMPLTLLAGIGGMSEWTMMTGPQNWKIAYPAFMALMVVIGVVTHFILRHFEGRNRENPPDVR
jgi:magnesium transporter